MIGAAVACRPGDCQRVLKGINNGDLTVHPDGRVTLLSDKKAQEEIANYQEILKGRPDCSSSSYWKAGLKAATADLNVTEIVVDKVIGGLIKEMDRMYGTVARGFGYFISAAVEGKEKAIQRLTEDTFEELAPPKAAHILQRGNLIILAYDIAKRAFKFNDAIWEHDKKCTYFKAVEGRITQTVEASVVPIAWVEPRKKQVPLQKNIPLAKPPQTVQDKPVTLVEQKVTFASIPEERIDRQEDADCPVFTVIHLNPCHFKETGVGFVADFGDAFSAGVAVHPMKPERCTLILRHEITDELNGSIALQPGNIKKTIVGANFGAENVNAGVAVSLDGKDMRLKVGGNIEGIDAAICFDPKQPLRKDVHVEIHQNIEGLPCKLSVDLNPHKPLKATIGGEAVVPVYGVPVNVGVKIQLCKPQDAQVKVRLPAQFFDPVLPKKMRLGDIQILSVNLKKFRHGIKKVIGMGGKKSEALKKAQVQVAEMEAGLERVKQMREQWFRELSELAVQMVDDKLNPVLMDEIKALRGELEQFVGKIAKLPTIDFPKIERQPLNVELNQLIWNEAQWREFFANAADAIFEVREENKALERLCLQLDEISISLLQFSEKSSALSEHYQEAQATFDETIRLLQIVNNNQVLLARLKENVSSK